MLFYSKFPPKSRLYHVEKVFHPYIFAVGGSFLTVLKVSYILESQGEKLFFIATAKLGEAKHIVQFEGFEQEKFDQF